MYIAIGGDMAVRESSILGIFDLDNTTYSRHTRNFLKNAEENGMVISVTDDLPKAFVLTEEFGLDRLQKVLNDSKDSPVRLMCRKVRMVLQTRIDTPTWNGIGKFGANNVY